MVNVRIYVEGGGDGKSLKIECRKGFRTLLEKEGFAGKMPGIIACGRREKAYKDYCTAQSQATANDFPLQPGGKTAPNLAAICKP